MPAGDRAGADRRPQDPRAGDHGRRHPDERLARFRPVGASLTRSRAGPSRSAHPRTKATCNRESDRTGHGRALADARIAIDPPQQAGIAAGLSPCRSGVRLLRRSECRLARERASTTVPARPRRPEASASMQRSERNPRTRFFPPSERVSRFGASRSAAAPGPSREARHGCDLAFPSAGSDARCRGDVPGLLGGPERPGHRNGPPCRRLPKTRLASSPASSSRRKM